MIPSAITVSLVPEARGGPFVFWDDLPAACRKAGALGYDAVEIFPPGPDAIDAKALRGLLDENRLKIAALGTGAGWVKHKLHLCLPDAEQRKKARAFIRSIIDLAGQFSAPAIIGSMQGRWGDVPRDAAMGYVGEALNDLGEHAKQYGVPLIYEPLNRYETNIANTVEGGVALLNTLSTKNVVLLADLFHMNIEEVDIAVALKAGGKHIGHVHFVDSNRRPAGCGHLDFKPIAAALKKMDYQGYVSAEAFPYPDPDQAAKLTMDAYRKYFGK
jgi:sugar phosphate isomerase/epimerase